MKQELVFLILVGSASAALNATWNFQGLTLYITDLGTQLTEDQIDKLADTYFQVYPKERHLYNNMSSAGVRLIFDPNYKDVAMTWGDVVTINPDFVQNHPEDLDFLTHELMHVVQFSEFLGRGKKCFDCGLVGFQHANKINITLHNRNKILTQPPNSLAHSNPTFFRKTQQQMENFRGPLASRRYRRLRSRPGWHQQRGNWMGASVRLRAGPGLHQRLR